MRVLACVPFFVVLVSGSARASELPPADLGALLEEAGAANPEVLALAARARAANELPGQLEELPDPKLSVSYTNDSLDSFTLGSSEFSNLTVGWEQDVPYRSVRARAADVARADADTARVSTDALRAKLRTRIITQYTDLYRIDRSADFLAESRDLLIAELAAARARYESGEGIQEELLRTQTEIRKLELRSESYRRERRAVEISIGEALGRSDYAPLGRAVALPDGRLPDDRDTLSEAAAAAAPDVREADARTHRAEAAVANAQAQNQPEFSWVAAYQFRGGLDPMVMGGFGVRLPVWKDRKQARAVAGSEADLDATRFEYRRAALRAAADAQAFVNEVDSAERSLRLYREAILPQDIATLEAARAAFSAGRAPIVLVIEDLRRWLDDRDDALALEVRRIQMLASLESATGMPLLDITSAGRTP
jgi:outer membrane protein TolC